MTTVRPATPTDEDAVLALASQLMAAFEDRARSRGARLVALATRRAGDFYAAMGYERSATYFRKIL